MRLHQRKCFIFLFLLSLLPVCSQIVSAQNKIREKSLSGESPAFAPEAEKPTAADLFSPSTNIDGAGGIDPTEAVKELSAAIYKSEIKDIKYSFEPTKTNKRQLEFDGAADNDLKKFPFNPKHSPAVLPANDTQDTPRDESFQWRSAIGQSLVFLGVQHGYAILGQAKTRRALKHGAFFRDYADSVKSLHGWSDGGRFFTNYIAHPMQGSLTGFIFVQNSPQARKQQFGTSGDYWRSRLKAMAWTAAWSTQFEIGPISQASIGNVGLKGKQTWEDIVVTPTMGTAMLVTEDAVDRFVMQRIERRTDNFYVKIFSRMLLSPTRVFANMLRLKAPWYRDRPPAR